MVLKIHNFFKQKLKACFLLWGGHSVLDSLVANRKVKTIQISKENISAKKSLDCNVLLISGNFYLILGLYILIVPILVNTFKKNFLTVC